MSTLTSLRPKSKSPTPSSGTSCQVIAFETELGWIGIALAGHIISRVKFGYQNEGELLAEFDLPFERVEKLNLYEREVVEKFTRFALGKEENFDELEIDQSWMTPFQRSVTMACRSIAYGETMSYGELAELAGSPKAARAVGSVMSNNRYPLIVPCHRIVSCGGGLGGFSAPRGTSLKIQLLQLERAEGFCKSGSSA